MSQLCKYFSSVGVKRLSQVEVIAKLSNQHEFNGIGDFKRMFGSQKKKFNAKYIFISDDESQMLNEDGTLTWYDARENHPTRSEFRLYYSANDVLKNAQVGDLVVLAQIDSNNIAVIIARSGTTSEKQLLWLFDLSIITDKFTVKDLSKSSNDLSFARKYIMSSLGFEIEEYAPDFLEEMLTLFGKKFPTTKEFSQYARSTVKDISPIEAPDETIIAWMEREELLFKTLEKEIIKESLQNGFGEDGLDVDEFIRFSLSVQNRRKVRAGFAFENNLAVIFSANKIDFSHGSVTERNNKPDFIFPSIQQYHDNDFDKDLLTMLGVKTTAKDRWRQVLSEAERIPHKHLVTLEPAISKNQTEDMKANNLQLIIPDPLLSTFLPTQLVDIINLSTFITYLKDRQNIFIKNNLLF